MEYRGGGTVRARAYGGHGALFCFGGRMLGDMLWAILEIDGVNRK